MYAPAIPVLAPLVMLVGAAAVLLVALAAAWAVDTASRRR